MVPNEPPRDDGYQVALGAELLGEIGPLSSFLHDTGVVVIMIHLHWEIQGRRSGGGGVVIGGRT
jgi:hypothetical protein